MEYLNIDKFLGTLPYMGKGMFGILIVTLIIIGAVMVLNAFGNAVSKENKQ